MHIDMVMIEFLVKLFKVNTTLECLQSESVKILDFQVKWYMPIFTPTDLLQVCTNSYIVRRITDRYSAISFLISVLILLQ